MKRFNRAKWVAALLMCEVLTSAARAQEAAVPAVPAAAPAAPAPANLWSFLGLSHENLAKCKDKFCKSGLSTLARSMMTPFRMIGGGLLPECCPLVPTAADIAKLANASSAESAAAKIKADEAASKERRLAVRYLGTVDCHYYPEAEAGIIAALRGDRIECVRIEAALALLNGCCCTKKTIDALNIVVTGSDKDGNPSETSERVKCIAYQALYRCMAQPMFNAGPAPEPPELPPAPAPGPVVQATFQLTPSTSLLNTPAAESPYDQARRTFAERLSAPNQQKMPTGNRSLFQLIAQSRAPLQELEPPPMPRKVAPPPAPLVPIGQLPDMQYVAPVYVPNAQIGFMPR